MNPALQQPDSIQTNLLDGIGGGALVFKYLSAIDLG
jgi:hypothetical protein